MLQKFAVDSTAFFAYLANHRCIPASHIRTGFLETVNGTAYVVISMFDREVDAWFGELGTHRAIPVEEAEILFNTCEKVTEKIEYRVDGWHVDFFLTCAVKDTILAWSNREGDKPSFCTDACSCSEYELAAKRIP